MAGSPVFQDSGALAESGADGMVIADLPKKIPGLGTCSACVATKSVHFPHKEAQNRAGAYLDRVHIDIAGSNAHGPRNRLVERNMSISCGDYSRAVYTRPLGLKPNAPAAFKILKAAAENESQKMIVMTDNARELSMGEMRQTCEQEGIKHYTSVRYSPELNGAAERTIVVLNNAVRAMPHDSGLSSPMGRVQCSDRCA